jgi:hypothetical protein
MKIDIYGLSPLVAFTIDTVFSVRCELRSKETIDITAEHDWFAHCARYFDVDKVSVMIDFKPVAKVRADLKIWIALNGKIFISNSGIFCVFLNIHQFST